MPIETRNGHPWRVTASGYAVRLCALTDSKSSDQTGRCFCDADNARNIEEPARRTILECNRCGLNMHADENGNMPPHRAVGAIVCTAERHEYRPADAPPIRKPRASRARKGIAAGASVGCAQ